MRHTNKKGKWTNTALLKKMYDLKVRCRKVLKLEIKTKLYKGEFGKGTYVFVHFFHFTDKIVTKHLQLSWFKIFFS